MTKIVPLTLALLTAIGGLFAGGAAIGQGKAPVAEPNRGVDQVPVYTYACAIALQACLLNEKQENVGSEVATYVVTFNSWREEVKSCAKTALTAAGCSSNAVIPGEIDKMRQEVAALVAATTGADCAPRPSGAKNPLCLPAPAAEPPASAPKPTLRRVEELTEIHCQVKNKVCLVLLVHDGVGREVLIPDKKFLGVFLHPQDQFCVVHTLEEREKLGSCSLQKLPLTRENGVAKIKIVKG